MINKIIIRYADGSIKKGVTEDFFPNKEMFHIRDNDDGEYKEIYVKQLKAVFFVKSFDGDPKYEEKSDIARVGLGRKIKVVFKDGETLHGYTQGFSRDRVGFIFYPSDPKSNNDKAFIVISATLKIEFEP